MEQPIVKAILDRRAEWKNKLSGKSDYLVAESIKSVGESKMREAAGLIDKGKGLQVISADDLIRALKGK